MKKEIVKIHKITNKDSDNGVFSHPHILNNLDIMIITVIHSK